jgi:hypothetical protein
LGNDEVGAIYQKTWLKGEGWCARISHSPSTLLADNDHCPGFDESIEGEPIKTSPQHCDLGGVETDGLVGIESGGDDHPGSHPHKVFHIKLIEANAYDGDQRWVEPEDN